MEFNEKLQELRLRKGLTQEELSKALFVSRTAVSKWESGKGYPNIESLKQISKLFSVTVDELLSSDELLSIAEKDGEQKEKRLRSLVFGLSDISALLLIFLPFFAEETDGVIKGVSLISLTAISAYLKTVYFLLAITTAIFGLLTLVLQNLNIPFKAKNTVSIALNILSVLVFIISREPYAAVFLFIFLIIKILSTRKMSGM